MDLRVQRENGENETITLIEPVTVFPSDRQLRDAAGVEHFFTQEGYYDGHGAMVTGFVESGNDWKILESMLEAWVMENTNTYEQRQSLIPIRDFIFDRTPRGKEFAANDDQTRTFREHRLC